MSIINSKNLSYIFRIILGIVFIYASYSKILDPKAFSDNIHNFHVTPIGVENLAALIIPWMELMRLLILRQLVQMTLRVHIRLIGKGS